MPSTNTAHAIVIGIANYQNVKPLPPTVVKDARDIYDLLIDPHVCAYPANNVHLLVDEQATQSGLRSGFAELAKRTTEDSTVLIYLSSHGGQIEQGPNAGEYLLPVDVVYRSGDSLAQTAISGHEFTEAMRAIPARKLVVIFDCCHAGGIGQPKDAAAPVLKSALPETYYDTLKAGRGRVILASSRSDELSWVFPGAQNSLFTQHILAGLNGGVIGVGGV